MGAIPPLIRNKKGLARMSETRILEVFGGVGGIRIVDRDSHGVV